MGLFGFLNKKKVPEAEPPKADAGVPVPTSQEAPDIYADLPAFSEKVTGDELLPPLKPIMRDTVPGLGPIKAEQNLEPIEDVPAPPQLELEEVSPQQPYTIPGIPPSEPPVPDAMPEPPALEEPKPEEPSLPEIRMGTKGPFVQAYELRQIFKEINDLNANIRTVQNIAIINTLMTSDAAAYERFHKSIENLQRKLMVAERMFMKV